MKIIALIPARAGSKSIKDKNLQRISGESLLEKTILHSQKVIQISDVYVSSDSDEILQFSRSLGCKPIKRPDLFSNDSATADDVVRDFLLQTRFIEVPEVLIVYLQPTSPFREIGMIEKGIEDYLRNSNPVIAVTDVYQHPFKTLKLDKSGKVEKYLENSDPTANRQSLPRAIIASGSLYIFSVQDFETNGGIPVSGATPIFVTGVYALDIDTEFDLIIAQKIGNDYEV
ncbi:N-acylneuraminate cytidylyltransferase [Candidatus Planktophila sulfonica]|uniref:N-acylneuraminate cytidylyltransferase n=1 Tax=Candidatus Planktophila sulfonica TaxID=1884904 RepID=A0A249KEY2_9ACTN|nr:acylneuraminate cytidylyltransferase family protein [Candidatus Planktophila sulfonica]ASY15354.1 N-acylneuraminate cytidylyltransferase [Candidatus Planktophila sulfonica]